jgi:hypothetical protein
MNSTESQNLSRRLSSGNVQIFKHLSMIDGWTSCQVFGGISFYGILENYEENRKPKKKEWLHTLEILILNETPNHSACLINQNLRDHIITALAKSLFPQLVNPYEYSKCTIRAVFQAFAKSCHWLAQKHLRPEYEYTYAPYRTDIAELAHEISIAIQGSKGRFVTISKADQDSIPISGCWCTLLIMVQASANIQTTLQASITHLPSSNPKIWSHLAEKQWWVEFFVI